VQVTREEDKKMTRRAHLKIGAAMMVAMAAAFVAPLAAPAGAASDLRPDLRMAAFDYFTEPFIESTSDGRRLLRFDGTIVNVGSGNFEVHGARPATTIPEMTVTQRVFNDAGGYRDRSTAARMYYSGDGHDHWHVRNLQRYTLTRLADRKMVGTGAKHGFCFWDVYSFSSSQGPFYTEPPACGQSPADLTVMMGISAGWLDVYPDWLPDQYIDITGVPPGKYRLRAVADPSNWFVEKDNTNNFTWINIRIRDDNTVDVLRHGPAAQPIG
jgi:hypothetical protein